MQKMAWTLCFMAAAGVASAQFSPGNPLAGLERFKNFEGAAGILLRPRLEKRQ